MTTPNDMEIIEGGWRTSCIQDAIKLGSKGLPPINPFEDIDPFINDNEAVNEANHLQAICVLTAEELSLGYSCHKGSENDYGDSNWEWKHKHGAFNDFEDLLNE